MPITYTVSTNEYVLSDVTQDELNLIVYLIAGLVAISLIILIVRYKTQGIVNAFSYVGLASLLYYYLGIQM